MASCQSRKTGNCSDYSQNKLLQEKAPETFPESFLIPGIAYFPRRPGRGVAITYGNGEAPLDVLSCDLRRVSMCGRWYGF